MRDRNHPFFVGDKVILIDSGLSGAVLKDHGDRFYLVNVAMPESSYIALKINAKGLKLAKSDASTNT
jgi:hypothetical protein